MALPDFFIVGPPKAGTSALHQALSAHPELHLSRIKEPKHFLSPDVRPDPGGQRGPGDAHSAQEWVWQRDRYEALFAAAPPGARRGESTPFYLYDRSAQIRIAEAVPEARLIAVLRDPVDRAYSNWTHLWSDGLEPVADFMEACEAEEARVEAGFAPFWHYRRLGLYGAQLEHLFGLFPREQVHVIRYRQLVDTPRETLNAICGFLGVEEGLPLVIPPMNTRPHVRPSLRMSTLGGLMRTGAALGAHARPQVWRTASRPLLWALHRHGRPQPDVSVDARRRLLQFFRDDIALLERVLGGSFSAWLGDRGHGAFSTRSLDQAS